MKKIIGLVLIILSFVSGLLAQNPDPLKIADSFFVKFEYEKAIENYEIALHEQMGSYDILWKYSRALIDAGELMPDNDKRIAYYDKAVELAETAISMNELRWEGHLYASISYGRKALAVGAKERMRLSKRIKKEAIRTIELNQNVDLAYHVLGRWHRKISSLNWLEKKWANMFLGGVPKDASKKTAIDLFKKAIQLNPDYINHYLELGITLSDLKLYTEARAALDMATSIKPVGPRNIRYHESAKKLLKKIEEK